MKTFKQQIKAPRGRDPNASILKPSTSRSGVSTPRSNLNIVTKKANPEVILHDPKEPRKYPNRPQIRHSVTTGPSGRWGEDVIREDGGAIASGMSVGGGSVAPISGPNGPDPSAVYSLQRNNELKHHLKDKLKDQLKDRLQQLFRRNNPI